AEMAPWAASDGPFANVSHMSKILVVAEKPSVGRDLASALPGKFEKHEAYLESDEYVITWAVGHLVQLAEPEEYDEKWKKWRMADLPIVPPNGFKLVPRDAKAKKQLKLIETLLKREDVDRIINACDAGGEGELIFAYVYESVFGASATSPDPPKPVERLWISSMTKQAIREGFERLRPGPQLNSLELAARSRSEADWLVGMNATRAATIRGRAWVGGVVSLGRVQTPTLGMLVKRERELQAAQSLYEGKKAITYPRTSSRYLSGDMVPQLKPTAGTLEPIQDYRKAAEYVLALDQLPLQRVVNDAKVDDHHAIIPTDVDHDVEAFTPDERRVFDLVARRFLAVFHPPARYARTTVITLVEEERFRTRGKITL